MPLQPQPMGEWHPGTSSPRHPSHGCPPRTQSAAEHEPHSPTSSKTLQSGEGGGSSDHPEVVHYILILLIPLFFYPLYFESMLEGGFYSNFNCTYSSSTKVDKNNDGSAVAIYETTATLFVVNHAKFQCTQKR